MPEPIQNIAENDDEVLNDLPIDGEDEPNPIVGSRYVLMAVVFMVIALTIALAIGRPIYTRDSPNEAVKYSTTQLDKISRLLDEQGSKIEGLKNKIDLILNKENESPLPCKDIKSAHPNRSSTGYYHTNGHTIYCNMDQLCGSGGGWTRLAYLDMSDVTQDCPTGFTLYTIGDTRACGKPPSTSGSCVSVKFQSNDIQYSKVCGKLEGHKKGTPDAFFRFDDEHKSDINTYYIDGVSITHGSPRQHIWSFVASSATTLHGGGIFNCPCIPGSTQQHPSFVGDNYYCESGDDDPLWDGQGCSNLEIDCCASPYLPWFYRQYNASTTDYIELRLCTDQSNDDEAVYVRLYEIYVM